MEVSTRAARTLESRDNIPDLAFSPIDHIVFYLRAQNAALFVTRKADDILFEAFELLPPNSRIMSCRGSLLQEFPECAALVKLHVVSSEAFLTVFIEVMTKLELDIAPNAQPKAKKAGVEHAEERDTMSPFLVTGMVMDVLAGLGCRVQPSRYIKRSREQVDCSNTRLPFHRSPVWLLLRVSLRLALEHGQILSNEWSSQGLYKALLAFHHCRLLQDATRRGFGSEVLYCMGAKVARRVLKLDPPCQRPWLREAMTAVEAARLVLQKRWEKVQESDNTQLPLERLSSLSLDDDCQLRLRNLRNYMSWMESRAPARRAKVGPGDPTAFHILPPMALPTTQSLASRSHGVQNFELLEFEDWVDCNLGPWLERCQDPLSSQTSSGHMHAEAQVDQLNDLIFAYYKRASKSYQGIPEALSAMFLTIMELWVALDNIAGRAVKLLLNYDPGLNPDLLQPLLLSTKRQMQRLQAVEQYLVCRQQRAGGSYPSAFSNFGDPHSLAVRYVHSSRSHQTLLEEITAKAERDKAAKIREYEEMRYLHDSRVRERNRMDHNDSRDRWGDMAHQPYACRRCRLDGQIKSMRIDVFEWPLPADDNHAMATVFEIDVDKTVRLWRSATMELLTKVFREEAVKRTGTKLSWAGSHSGLQQFVRCSSRLYPASHVKRTNESHYRDQHISQATRQNVCVEHGTLYSYYDADLAIKPETAEWASGSRVPPNCSYARPGLFEDWVRSTRHTSNEVIAAQWSCPGDMSLEEFRAVGNLRSGAGLQWANILCQLVIPAIDLNKQLCHDLIMQACLEAGAPGAGRHVLRMAHADAGCERYAGKAIKALREALLRVQDSWQNETTLCLIARLSARLFSLSPSRAVSDEMLELLAAIRKVSIGWVRELVRKLDENVSISHRDSLSRRVLMSSLICAITFDVGAESLHSVLNSRDNLSIYTEVAASVHDHLPGDGVPSERIPRFLFDRWQRISHLSYTTVTEDVVSRGNGGLDTTMKIFWSEYAPSRSGWQVDELPRGHVLVSNTDTPDGPMTVSFNLLKGLVLVNGHPLARLSESYQTHPTFIQLFGRQILDVMPSAIPEMQFSARRDQMGWGVHFAMTDAKLVIRAISRDISPLGNASPTMWEYIPREYLNEDLPATFVKRYSHWMNLSNQIIQFRPVQQPWMSVPDSWALSSGTLSKGVCRVIDPYSNTAEQIVKIMEPLESKYNINCIFNSHVDSLEVELPRFSLSFTLAREDSVLSSKNYPGMCVNRSQGIGALIGLKSKLVLGPAEPSSTRPKAVLIPQGEFSPRIAGNHVEVLAHPSSRNRIRHHIFEANTTIGLLSDSGALSSKLLICYLHALTSHCLPDPLTRRTGTEEAFRLLGSVALRSFQRLDANSAHYLQAIADLSPQRAYYPDHLQVMETVEWNSNLLSLSQHDAFWQMAQAIHEHFKSFCEIFPDVNKETVAPKLRGESSRLLVERARLRNATFRVSEFGAEVGRGSCNDNQQNRSEYDHWYHSKDGRHLGPSKECNRASLVARCLDAGVQRSLFRPQGSIQDIIRQVTGESFSGTTKASLQVNLENLRPPLESIGEFWCNLHTSLAAEKNKYRIMFFLAFLLYATGAKWEIVQVLMVLSMPEPSTSICPPAEPSFNLAITRATFKGDATEVASRLVHGREECPEWRRPRNHGETNREYITRRHNLWCSESERLKSRFVDDLNTQLNGAWILRTPTGEPYGSYMDVASIMQSVQDLARTAKRSHDFFGYLDDVAAILRQTDLMPAQDRTKISETRPLPTDKLPDLSKRFISANSLFSCPAPSFDRPKLAHCVAQHSAESPGKTMQEQARPVSSLLERLWKKASQDHQRAYIQELRGSAESIGVSSAVSAGTVSLVDPSPTAQTPKKPANKIAAAINKALTGGSVARDICLAAGMYPRLSPVFALGRLARAHWGSLSREWQRCLVNYALSLVYLQRAERLASFIGNPNRKRELQRELANLGSHDEFDPLNHPEGLLLELEQGILIRQVQQKIAATMTAPPGGKGAVMQLNMGEGKSSVIVPLVASALADGSRVVRVVVAKPQSKQMMHTLITKLGGLINRRVLYLPFSRSIRLSPDQVGSVRAMIQACQQEGGVLLVQPEHLLSFKLMGIEKIWHEAQQNPTMGDDILQLYQEFEAVSRDIVDESDENFSVKFELIYTMGSQQPVEMSPERWILIEAVMELLRDVVKRLARSESGGGDLEGLLFEERQDKSGGFPTIRVLEDAAGQRLGETLAHQICALGLPGFPVHNVTASMRRAILAYMLKENLSQDEISSVEKADNGFFGESKTKQGLLLLRGLLAKGILLFALGQKRYRVNYGLAPDRCPPTMLAVPFRAKDMPSPRSEFSHPDVVIVLTCLSYYYRGLADDELFTSLELLSKSDLADQEYGIWTSAAPALSPTLRHFSGVNLKDQARCRQSLFPALRYVKPAVDFYLSNVVFAKEMKEFPSKLSASGWDLAKPKAHPLTGFSGTIDSKRVLPLAVEALDLPDQRYNNAAVLDCLLGNENEVLELGEGPSQLSVLDTLLDAVTKNGMRVILDVGAQIIECSNAQLAKHWLESAPASETDAVIYFEDNDELSVVARDGTVDAFLTSPFTSNTERCLVFLDQAHTRGTDLRLPDRYRAAVTLGPAITKDTLVQGIFFFLSRESPAVSTDTMATACMRMRKLGHGQSVTFCVSQEMQKRIRTTCGADPSQSIAVVNVLEWAISETWEEEVRSIPLWENQGIRHLYQETIWDRVARKKKFSQRDAQDYTEPEARTLEHRYRPISAAMLSLGPLTLLGKLTAALCPSDIGKQQLGFIQQKAEAFKLASAAQSANFQEEQERELAPEIEQERQVERPPQVAPKPHSLHDDVIHFACTGELRLASAAFLSSFQALEKSSAVQYFPPGVSNFPSDLLITADYAHTVDERGQGFCSDMYQRPVQWVITSKSHMVVISQWEANKLKQLGSCSSHAMLRAYLPRPSLTFRTLEDLQIYTVPATASDEVRPELIMQLNLFAGQLYLRSYQHYVALCRYLGLSYMENRGDKEIAADGFVRRKEGEYAGCRFETSPIMFLNVLIQKLRRDCMGIEKTHMGKILAGEILTEKDFPEEEA